MDRKNVQITPWGRIEWIVRPEEENRSMSMGMIILEPGREQVKHMHIGDEQCLVTISGQGKSIINDCVSYIMEKDINYFPPYSMHATINNGKEPLVQLMVSCPVRTNLPLLKYDMSKTLMDHIDSFDLDEKELAGYIDEYLEEFDTENFVYTQFPLAFCTAENVPVVLCDIPEICKRKCGITEERILCPEAVSLVEEKEWQYSDSKVNVIECPYGEMVLISKISFCNRTVGYLQGGYFDDIDNLIDTTLYGVIQMLEEISTGIGNACMESVVQRLTQHKSSQFVSEKEKSTVLGAALEESQDRLLRMEIKNHFLFNTLNSIAALSLTAERAEVYQSILNLSAMFRNQLKKTGTMVTLETEVEAQETYMELMKLRFSGKITTRLLLEESCRDIKIPFNTLQPFVENSFVHGFLKDGSRKQELSIACKSKEEEIYITVKDNGQGMSPELLKRTREALTDSKPHGIGMAYALLMKAYQGRFSVEINSKAGKGTEVVIVIPRR